MMRTRTINLLAIALLVFSAGSVSAYEISHGAYGDYSVPDGLQPSLGTSESSAIPYVIDYFVRGGLQPTYTTSDTVTIDVFLDVESSITLLSVAVLATAGELR